MNSKVAVRKCREYDFHNVFSLISDIYSACDGPDVSGKKVLVKPNILIDSDPSKCICTHPVVVEAMVRYLLSKGAIVSVGDSPAVHLRGFKSEKSGIYQVCQKTGVQWIDFTKDPSEVHLKSGKIRISSFALEADLIISLPKFKNHELVFFTGAIKNSLGLVPGFSKAKQHAVHNDRNSFASFLVERRPVFIHNNCIGCLECIKICPVNAIKMHTVKQNYVVLTDSKCIRYFCCSEVCQSNAVEIRRKFFGN